MHVHILGGGDEVGASCALLSMNGANILVDAGIRMGSRTLYGGPQDQLPDLARLQDLGGVDAVVVTHAHTDHIGALPLVHQAYPKAPMYATQATIDLMQILLADALRLMQAKAEREMELPLYDAALVERMVANLHAVEFGRPTRLLPADVVAQYFPSGHILGAAAVSLHSSEGSVLMTGDVSMTDQRTIPGMLVPPVKPDLVVAESTYGNRLHANRRDEEARLARKVADVIGRGGKVLIPAFAVGRAQEVILILQAFQRDGQIPRCRIWVDGMVRSVCEAYSRHPDLVMPFLRRRMEEQPNPFYWKNGTARAVTSAKQREQILAGGPCVIVASSGMLTGGPSQFYAADIVRHEENALLITGYQDEEAPGRRLLDLADGAGGYIRLDEAEIPVHAEVSKYTLSAHADGGEIARLVSALAPDAVLFVHGEDVARAALRDQIDGPRVVLPHNGEGFEHRVERRSASEPSRPGVGRGVPLTEDTLPRLWEAALRASRSKGKGPRPFRAADLTALWYGTHFTPEQLQTVENLIASDQPFFRIDRRRTYLYHAVSRAQVGKVVRRAERMREIGPVVAGNLLLVTGEDGTPAPALCYEVADEGFHAWQVGESKTFLPAEAYLAVVGPFPVAGIDAGTAKQRLRTIQDAARNLWCIVDLARVRREEPLDLSETVEMLGFSTGSLVHRLAVAWLLFEGVPGVDVSEAGSGEPAFSISNGTEIPDRMRHAVETPLEQNAAFELLEAFLPDEAGLYHTGADRERGVLRLSFHFPDVVTKKWGKTLAKVAEATGWEIDVNPRPHQAMLSSVAKELLAGRLLKEPSIHLDRGAVSVVVEGQVVPKEADEWDDTFLQQTGFTLEIETRMSNGQLEAAATGDLKFEEAGAYAGPPPGQVEINESFACIERRFAELGVALHKKSRKMGPRGPYIELSFLTPEIGRRSRGVIEELEERLRWPIRVNPRPNQIGLQDLAVSLVSSAARVVKQPSYFGDQKLLRVRVSGCRNEAIIRDIQDEFERQTGYRLVLDVDDMRG